MPHPVNASTRRDRTVLAGRRAGRRRGDSWRIAAGGSASCSLVAGAGGDVGRLAGDSDGRGPAVVGTGRRGRRSRRWVGCRRAGCATAAAAAVAAAGRMRGRAWDWGTRGRTARAGSRRRCRLVVAGGGRMKACWDTRWDGTMAAGRMMNG